MLWTRQILTAGDQEWFKSIETELELHLWTGETLEELLEGDCEVLRSTYFGDLVLLPGSLGDLHALALAPVKRRWIPEVHQSTQAERWLRKWLGEPDAWNDLELLARHIASSVVALRSDLQDSSVPYRASLNVLIDLSIQYEQVLRETLDQIKRADVPAVLAGVKTRPQVRSRVLAKLPYALRNRRCVAALSATNALSLLREADRVLVAVSRAFTTPLIAVSADAGCGKTELAIALTQETSSRPAGILIHAGQLFSSGGLNDLAHHVVINARPVESMEALIAALDAAAQRSRGYEPVT